MSRRRLFGLASAVGVGGALLGSGAGYAGARTVDPPLRALGATRLPFHGRHQGGIVAPDQAHGWVAAFDLEPGTTRAAVADLMRAWTAAAERMTAGRPPADDDAMADGYGPASLTVTVGFGAGLLSRLGLEAQMPDALTPIPPFPNDELDPRRSGGDIGVVLAGDDAIVVAHAFRALARLARGTARVRWQMTGFSTGPGVLPSRHATPRNLMGQLDGTNNPTPADPGFAGKIFVADDGRPAWMRGGTYLVVRRIRMLLDAWDDLDREQQERIIGRRKDTGAPLSGGSEHTPVDLTKQNPDGSLAIPPDAHIRLAAPETNGGATILRRGFSYFDGYRPDGAPDAGLIFLAFQADPRRGFVPIQQRLALADGLSRFIRHESNALFAVPGGCRPGEFLGQALLQP